MPPGFRADGAGRCCYKADNEIGEWLRLIQRQEVAAAVDGRHRHSRNQPAVALAGFAWGPIVFTVDEKGWNSDTRVFVPRVGPAFLMREQAQESLVVPTSRTNVVELLFELRR